jgi:uncharacterized membrane protein YgcG
MFLCTATALAATISGVVTNATTGKPSSGDTIAVINTAQSMDEIAKVTSDSSGSFHVNAPDGGQILLHITHAGAEYFKSVSSGTASVDIQVYDSAKKIDGLTAEAMVVRVETDPSGKTLNVAQNFFVQNGSTPPRTEYGGNTFDFFVPKDAVISMTLANAPGGLPTNVKTVAIDAAAGHYAFTFPLRPGETRFQAAYSLPYNGTKPFSLKLSMATGDVAVMLPKSMHFEGSAAFQAISPDPDSQSFDAHEVAVNQPVQFTISGSGQLPQTQNTAPGSGMGGGGGGQSSSGSVSSGGTRPGGGLGAPDDPEGTNDPWAKYKWWILGALGLALAGGAGVMLKKNPVLAVAIPGSTIDTDSLAPIQVPAMAVRPAAVATPVAIAPVPVSGVAGPVVAAPGLLLQALKDELFELETDHISGKLSDSEYADQKAAFHLVLRRILKRVGPG